MRLLYLLLPLVSAEYLNPVTDLLQICISNHSYISSTVGENHPYGYAGEIMYYCQCEAGYSPHMFFGDQDYTTTWNYIDVKDGGNDADGRIIGDYMRSGAVNTEQGKSLVVCERVVDGCKDELACNYNNAENEIPNSCLYATGECEVCERGKVVHRGEDEDGDGVCDGDEEPPLDPDTDLQKICQTANAHIKFKHYESIFNEYFCECDQGYDLMKNGESWTEPIWIYTDYYYSDDSTNFPTGYACTGDVVGSGTNKVLSGLAVLVALCTNYIHLS